MPSNLKRYFGAGDFHFITCSCQRRRPLLGSARRRDLFLAILEQTRQSYGFVVLGYVVMPEHFHLLISEPERADPSVVMKVLKQRFAQQVLRRVRQQYALQAHLGEDSSDDRHIWQRRFYDFNVWSDCKCKEKLRYMHANPVKRGLVRAPEEWPWSSYRAYAHGEEGWVRINFPQPALKVHNLQQREND
jgi:putative transposase